MLKKIELIRLDKLYLIGIKVNKMLEKSKKRLLAIYIIISLIDIIGPWHPNKKNLMLSEGGGSNDIASFIGFVLITILFWVIWSTLESESRLKTWHWFCFSALGLFFFGAIMYRVF